MGKKISMEEAAAHLGVNKRTIRRLIAARKLPAYKLGGKLIRIDIDDLENLLRPVLPPSAR